MLKQKLQFHNVVTLINTSLICSIFNILISGNITEENIKQVEMCVFNEQNYLVTSINLFAFTKTSYRNITTAFQLFMSTRYD